MAYPVQKKSVSAPSRSTSSAAEFMVATRTTGCKAERELQQKYKDQRKGQQKEARRYG
jgi:hypothetical protein